MRRGRKRCHPFWREWRMLWVGCQAPDVLIDTSIGAELGRDRDRKPAYLFEELFDV